MITFYKHLRKELMETGKTGKYLKYALGEIALVMIGILLALQVNNWNENRIKTDKETGILANIHKEFMQNKKQLDSVVAQHKAVYSHCSKIMSLFPIPSNPAPAVLDSLQVHLFNSYGGITFNPSQTTVNALASTSSFNIIKNEKLRDLLISWNDLIEDYQEEESLSVTHIWSQYDPYMSKHFDWAFNFKDARNDFAALQTLEFEFLVRNRHDFVGQILETSGELQKVQKTLDEIIRLTEPTTN